MRAGEGSVEYGESLGSTLGLCDAYFTGPNAAGGGKRIPPRFDDQEGDYDYEAPDHYYH